ADTSLPPEQKHALQKRNAAMRSGAFPLRAARRQGESVPLPRVERDAREASNAPSRSNLLLARRLFRAFLARKHLPGPRLDVRQMLAQVSGVFPEFPPRKKSKARCCREIRCDPIRSCPCLRRMPRPGRPGKA